MEQVSYAMGKRYSDIMKTMWFTCFYSQLIPIGGFLSMLGLSIYYWVDKYNLIRRRTVTETISIELTIRMIDMLDLSVIFFTVIRIFLREVWTLVL